MPSLHSGVVIWLSGGSFPFLAEPPSILARECGTEKGKIEVIAIDRKELNI